MFSQLGIPGVILLIVVCLLVFGTKNLPNIGRSVGSSIREFKESFAEKETTPQEIEEKVLKHERDT